MPQQKSTSFSAAKVANFGVVMAEMVGELMKRDKEIKRLRHHVSVLSKRNHRLEMEGKSRAASSIASDASLSSDDEEVEWEEEGEEKRVKVVKTLVGEEAREKAHENGVPDPWCEKGAKEFNEECQERGRYLGRTKWKVAELDVAESVVAESVEVAEEAEVAKPVVRLPKREEGSKKRRIGEKSEEEKEVQAVRELIAPAGPRAECGRLLRVVGKESVFDRADPGLVAEGPSTHASVRVSRGTEAWRQRPGAIGKGVLRPGVGYGQSWHGGGVRSTGYGFRRNYF